MLSERPNILKHNMYSNIHDSNIHHMEDILSQDDGAEAAAAAAVDHVSLLKR
jgi:putative N-acetylmannosamine-6-phosphate epimerase